MTETLLFPAQIIVETHQDLRKHMREICRRLNDHPELARLVLVNPIFAFEDAGITMSQEVKDHIRQTLRHPKKLDERKALLEKELAAELPLISEQAEIPRSPEARARLVFKTLGLSPLCESDNDGLDLRRLSAYAAAHPLIDKLVRFERADRGGQILHTKGSYNAFKEGKRRHKWVKSIRFKI